MSTIVHSLRDYRAPKRAQQFAYAFALPDGEGPYVDASGSSAEIMSAVLSLVNPGATESEDLIYTGRLTLTQSFLCFLSQGDYGRGCRMALPLCAIRRVERLHTRDTMFALSITVWHGMQLVLQLNALRPTCDGFCAVLRDRLRAHLSGMKKLQPFLQTCFSESLIGEGHHEGAEDSTTTPGDVPYLQGLGAEFGYPGDPKKCVHADQAEG